MTILVYYPLPLLVLSSLGIGGLLLLRWRHTLLAFPIWLHTTIGYFVGQAVLAVLLLVLALTGGFSTQVVFWLLLAGAAPFPWLLWRARSEWGDYLRRLWSGFSKAPIPWQILTAMVVGLFLYGFGLLGAMPAGDARAFYLPISKTTAHAQQLLPLPVFETFTASVGLYAETLIAALIRLGLPYHLTRLYSWINFLPTLVLLWGLARIIGLSRRAQLLAVCVALTSSTAIVLGADGKTDLFAVGPALASCVIGLAAWKLQSGWGVHFLAGLLCGYAIVLQSSLLLVLLPTLVILIKWPQWTDLAARKGWAIKPRIAAFNRRDALDLGVVGFGLILMLTPHIAKNILLGGPVFGLDVADTTSYSAATIGRLVLTYPLALTYGRYWAQYGHLSPLVLAFLPLLLLLPRPASWRNSALGAITVATAAGLVLWVALMPAVLMPRYILAALLLLGIPTAAAADAFSRRTRTTGLIVILATAVTILYTPTQLGTWGTAIDWKNTWEQLTHPLDDRLAARDDGLYQAAHVINSAAESSPTAAGRVMISSWYRVWLNADLLLHANTDQETRDIAESTNPWTLLRAHDFRFVMLDKRYPGTDALLKTLPPDSDLRLLYQDKTHAAYEILP
jgi:hypothetical protein